MSKPTTTNNKNMPPKIILANEAERIDYLASLLLEIAEEELRLCEEATCSPN